MTSAPDRPALDGAASTAAAQATVEAPHRRTGGAPRSSSGWPSDRSAGWILAGVLPTGPARAVIGWFVAGLVPAVAGEAALVER